MSPTYLDTILAAHRRAAKADDRPLEDLLDAARAVDEPTRGFAAALVDRPAGDGGDVAVIAEIKRRSPSKGDINPGVEPGPWARSYEEGGASCLSVLTDEQFFGGSATDLATARKAVSLPVIRKDFTVSSRDVCDARLMGADAVLLIVAALDDAELADFSALAAELSLDALVETHDEAEVERALAVDASLVGVNQRDLVTFEVDQARAVRVAAALPDGVTRVAESGIGGRADVEPLVAAGYHAVLVGESLMSNADPAGAVRGLRSA